MKKLLLFIAITCAYINTNAQITSRNTLKGYFVTGAKPTQAQFWAMLDSYTHKQDTISVNRIKDLYIPPGIDTMYMRSDTIFAKKSGVDFPVGVVSGSGGACVIDWNSITGSDPSVNSALMTFMANYQPVLPLPSPLDFTKYYYAAPGSLGNFNNDARAALQMSFDSAQYFGTYNDSNNLILQHASIANLDSAFQIGGFFLVTPTTRGTKPTTGTGFLLNLVQQQNKYTTGSGRIAQILFMHNTNRLYLRNGNNNVWGTWDSLAALPDVRTIAGSGGGSYLSIAGGSLTGTTAKIIFPKQTPSITYPTNNDIEIGNNNGRKFYFADSSGGGSALQFDLSLLTGMKSMIWPNQSGTVPLLSNSTGNFLNATSDNLSEGSTNLYYTPSRARVAISVIKAPLSYNSTSGAFDFDTSNWHSLNYYNTVFPRFDGSYANPSWITSLAQSKITYTGSAGQYVKGDGTFGTTPTILTKFIGAYSAGTLAASAINYGFINGSSSTVTSASTRTIVLFDAGTMSNFNLATSGTQDASGSLVATLFKNGSATSVVITIPASSSATTYSYTASTVSVSSGDYFYWKFQNNATNTSVALVNTYITFIQ